MNNYSVGMRMPGGRITAVIVAGYNVCDAEQNAKKLYPTYSLTGRTEQL